MDKELQKELIKKLYTNPLREKERKRRNKEEKESKQKVLFRTTQPILTNMNTNDYIDKLFNDNVNVNNLLNDLEKVHIKKNINNQGTRKRKRNTNEENTITNVKKIKLDLELEKIQEEI